MSVLGTRFRKPVQVQDYEEDEDENEEQKIIVAVRNSLGQNRILSGLYELGGLQDLRLFS